MIDIFNNKIKAYRKKKKLKIEAFSKLTGLSVDYISHLENGTRNNPSYKTMIKIANALQEDISNIFPTENGYEEIKEYKKRGYLK